MARLAALSLVVGLSLTSPARAQLAEPSVCEVGSSVVDLVYLQATGASARIDSTTLRASIIFLIECPAHVVSAFRTIGVRGPGSELDHVSELQRAWIVAVQSAARDSSNADTHALLAAARAAVAGLSDDSLNVYLDGVLDGMAAGRAGNQRTLHRVFERQALATFQEHARCEGVACFDASDNVLFLLGTHPIAVFKAMRADSADATRWLRLVADDSFAGPRERAEGRETARRAVLRALSETQAPGFERELHACEARLREIRYRPVQ